MTLDNCTFLEDVQFPASQFSDTSCSDVTFNTHRSHFGLDSAKLDRSMYKVLKEETELPLSVSVDVIGNGDYVHPMEVTFLPFLMWKKLTWKSVEYPRFFACFKALETEFNTLACYSSSCFLPSL